MTKPQSRPPARQHTHTSDADAQKATDIQAQQDAKAQDAAAAADDSTTLPHKKGTSRTAALRK